MTVAGRGLREAAERLERWKQRAEREPQDRGSAGPQNEHETPFGMGATGCAPIRAWFLAVSPREASRLPPPGTPVLATSDEIASEFLLGKAGGRQRVKAGGWRDENAER